MGNYKNCRLKKLDKNSQEFLELKEEYHSIRIVDFLYKHSIGSITASNLFGPKTDIKRGNFKKEQPKEIKETVIEETQNFNYYDREGYEVISYYA